MKINSLIIPLLLVLLSMAGCSKPSRYRLSGKLADAGTEWLDVNIRDDRGITSHRLRLDPDGSFRFDGTATAPVMLWISRPDTRRVIYSTAVVNGDKIDIQANLATAPDSIAVKGGRYAGAIGSFDLGLLEQRRAGDVRAVNEAVRSYVAAHPGDPSAAFVLANRYNAAGREHQADSLLGILTDEARIPALLGAMGALLSQQLSTEATDPVTPMLLYDVTDSMKRYSPSASALSLLAVDPYDRAGRDSVSRALTRLYELLPRSRFRAVEFSMAVDSASWVSSLRGDSSAWIRTWHPGLTASPKLRPLAIPSVPYFIVVDSAGNQLLRTSSVSRAETLIRGSL